MTSSSVIIWLVDCHCFLKLCSGDINSFFDGDIDVQIIDVKVYVCYYF